MGPRGAVPQCLRPSLGFCEVFRIAWSPHSYGLYPNLELRLEVSVVALQPAPQTAYPLGPRIPRYQISKFPALVASTSNV